MTCNKTQMIILCITFSQKKHGEVKRKRLTDIMAQLKELM